MKAEPFDLTQVRLHAGPFREAMRRDQTFLLQLEPDRLLHTFRVNAGLLSDAEPLGGWESPGAELRGHFLGHYLSACSLMYASTDDGRFKERADYIVAALARCQEALPAQGYNRGFLFASPESLFDRVDIRAPVWAPYYTLHKLIAGLTDAHLYCDNGQALEALEKLADWLRFRVERLPSERMQEALTMEEHGGISLALVNLYAVTGQPEHLELARAFKHEVFLEPLARGEDRLDRTHANGQIPKAIGAAREYELTGERRLRDAAEFFWQRVARRRSYAIGGNSDDEWFFPVERFAQHLSAVTCETCNTYNMLKLTRHVFAWEPTAEKMDYYERALVNHILGSQDPETGMMIYFAPLKPGHFKIYNTPDISFWCCTGTGIENHAKYGETIYFHDDVSLYVNLFIASELTWADKGLKLRQETQFPDSDSTRLTLRCDTPVTLALKIRNPAWALNISVAVNGRQETVQSSPGSYVTIEREWRDGDHVDVRLPMSLHLEELPGSPDTVAVLYGPVVLAGALGTENMPDVYLRDFFTRFTDVNTWPAPPVPALAGTAQEMISHIEPVDGCPLTFRTRDIGRPNDVELIPFYRLHHQRYNVYWQLLPDEELKTHAGA